VQLCGELDSFDAARGLADDGQRTVKAQRGADESADIRRVVDQVRTADPG